MYITNVSVLARYRGPVSARRYHPSAVMYWVTTLVKFEGIFNDKLYYGSMYYIEAEIIFYYELLACRLGGIISMLAQKWFILKLDTDPVMMSI